MSRKDGIIIKQGQVWKCDDGIYQIVSIEPDPSGLNPCRIVYWEGTGADQILQWAGNPGWWGFEKLIKSHDGADLEAARAEGWEVYVEGMEVPEGEVEAWSIWPDDREAWQDAIDSTPIWKDSITYRYKLKVNTCEHCSKAESECECFGITTCSACPHRETCESRLEGYERIDCDGFRGTSCLVCPKCGNQDELVASLNGEAVCYDCGRPQYKLFEIKWGEVPWLPDSVDGLRQAAVGNRHNGYRIFGFIDRNEPGYCCEMSITPCDHTGNRKYAIGRLEDGR
jgi:hypothetical protein